MKLGSLTSVVFTLGPDFQKVVTKNQSMTNTENSEHYMVCVFIKNILFLFRSISLCSSSSFSHLRDLFGPLELLSFGDFDLAILYYNLHVDPKF
jgi:formate hydrogenlyase subunit 4